MDIEYEVHQIKTFNFDWSNYNYIVVEKSSRSAFIVDPSWELDKISNKLTELKANLKAILLTHSHHDHVNLIDPLIDQFNPAIYMSKSEIDFYQFSCRNLNPILDGEKIKVGGLEVLCLLTPGHTAGSLCYFLPNSLFTGDTIFIEGCGICTEPGGSAEDMFNSVQRIKSSISPHVLVYPGHSYGKEPGQSLESLLEENIYFQIEKREHFVKFRMRKNQKDYLDFK